MATDWMARLRILGTYKVVTALIPIIIAATVVICVFILKNDSEALQTSTDGEGGVLVQRKTNAAIIFRKVSIGDISSKQNTDNVKHDNILIAEVTDNTVLDNGITVMNGGITGDIASNSDTEHDDNNVFTMVTDPQNKVLDNGITVINGGITEEKASNHDKVTDYVTVNDDYFACDEVGAETDGSVPDQHTVNKIIVYNNSFKVSEVIDVIGENNHHVSLIPQDGTRLFKLNLVHFFREAGQKT